MEPMENSLENDIRELAHHIWRTAGTDFSHTALDFWVMAEQMVVELTADSARQAQATVAAITENATTWPIALQTLYLYRIRELAYSMWATSTEQRENTRDYWLSAEKHLRLIAESSMRMAGINPDKQYFLAGAFKTFSSATHLEHIRKTAYELWEAAGYQYGSSLDFWLAAEKKILDSLRVATEVEKDNNSKGN